MTGRMLGEAWVTISPDTAGFRSALDAQLKKAMTGLQPTVMVGVTLNADTAKLRAQVKPQIDAALAGLKTDVNIGANVAPLTTAIAQTIASVKGTKANVNVGANTTPLTRSIAETVAAVTATKADIRLGANTTGLDAELAALAAKAQAFQDALGNLSSKDQNTQAFLKGLAQGADRIKASLASIGDASGVNTANAQLDRMITNADNVRKALLQTAAAGKSAGAALNQGSSQGLSYDLEEMKNRADELTAALRDMTARVNTDQPVANLNVLQAKANLLNERLETIKTDVGAASALVQMASLDAAAVKFRETLNLKKDGLPALDTALASSALSHLDQQAKDLANDISKTLSPSGITVGKVDHSTFSDLTNLQNALTHVREEIVMMNQSDSQLWNADDVAKINSLKNAVGTLSTAVAANGVSVTGATGSYRGWVNTIISIARTQIPLFNGAFEKMLPHFLAVASGFHLITEAAIETIAVWVPAAVALTEFGVAAIKSGYAVYQQFKNMLTVMDATGQSIDGLGNKGAASLSKLAQPYVYEAFGLGMVAMQKNATTTAGVIQSVGSTIDRWIAEAVQAWDRGTGQMSKTGASEFAVLGDSFKQLGTLIDAFIKMTPGYAKDLLAFGDGFLHLASAILNSPIVRAIGTFGLAFHGAFFYIGLATTLLTKLGGYFLRPLAGISMFSGALGKLGIESDGTKGKLAQLASAMSAGWKSAMDDSAAAVSVGAKAISDDLEAEFGSSGGGKIVTSAEGTMSKLKTAFATGMSAIGTSFSQGFAPVKSTLTEDVEGPVENTGTKFSDFKAAASDAMSTLGTNVAKDAAGIKGAMTGMLEGLGINPLVAGIALVGTALYLLVTKFGDANNAAQAFGSSVSKAVANSSLADFGHTVALSMQETKDAIAGLNTEVGTTGQSTSWLTGVMDSFGRTVKGIVTGNVNESIGALGMASERLTTLRAVLSQLQGQSATFTANANTMAKALGTNVTGALAAATAAGITTNQMMNDTGQQAADDTLQVVGYAKGLADMTQGLGGTKAALSALAIANSQQLGQIQQLASAQAAYTTLMTGGVGAFDTFVQGQATLTSNLKSAGANTSTTNQALSNYLTTTTKTAQAVSKYGTVTNSTTKSVTKGTSATSSSAAAAGSATLSLGKLSDKIKLAGASLDGLSPASVTANQAFLQQVNSAQALYGQMETLATASGNTATAQHQVSVGGKDLISTLLQTAAGSKGAMTQVYALAQTFGYTGNDTLPNLVKWLGTTGDKTKDLQVRINGLTAGAGNLANAAKALSGQMSTSLNTAMSQSIFDAEGGQKAFDAFAKSVRAFNNDQSAANLQNVIKQGKALSQSFIATAGSAKAAEPVLENYFMQMGVKSQSQAKALADQILGLSNATSATTRPMNSAKQEMAALALSMKAPVQDFKDLESAVGKVNFSRITGQGATLSTIMNGLQNGLHLTAAQTQALWGQFGKSNLDMIAGKTALAKTQFVDLLEKLGLTATAADAVWAAFSKQNLDTVTGKAGLSKTAFINLGNQMGISKAQANDLWTKLAQNDFSVLGGSVDTNRQKFMAWAKQAGITGSAANQMWTQVVAQQLQGIIQGHIKTNESNFVALEKQLGVTQGAAQGLWSMLKQAPNVKASVTVTGGVQGQAQAVAQATGSQQQVIGKLFFAQRAAGGPIPGKLPGFSNADNMLASAPSGMIALAGGEAIVPNRLANHPEFTSFAGKHGIPGFSTGGSVPGGLPGSALLPAMGQNYVDTRTNLANSQITVAGDSMQAMKIGAYNAFVDAANGVGGSVSGQAILADAEKWKGHPYVWGGASNPTQGWDCSSFVGYILGHDFHLPLPGPTAWNPNVHGPVAAEYVNEPGFHMVSHNVQDIQAGDLLVENSGGHVGFGVGPNQMFSAYGTAYGTIFSDAQNMTNILRDGAATAPASGATKSTDITSSDPLTEAMAKNAQKAYSTSTALAKLFPVLQGGYGGNPGVVSSGTDQQNLETIARYLMSQGASKAGAAGIAATISGESGGDPESVGSGGFGLIGWTGNTLGLPPGYAGPTGNASHDLAVQMQGIIGYAKGTGGWPGYFATATDPVAAGNVWSASYERPHVQFSDTRPAEAQALFAMGLANGGLVPGFATGGAVKKTASSANTNVFGELNSNMPLWALHTTSQLEAMEKTQQAVTQKYVDAMKYDSAHGLTQQYLNDSVTFNKDNTLLTSYKQAVTRREAFDKESPAQQDLDIANIDKAVSTHYSALQAQAFAQVQKLGAEIATLKKIKKPSSADQKNLAADEKLYNTGLAEYMSDGTLSAHWNTVYKQRLAKSGTGATGGTGSALQVMKPTNQVMAVAEKLTQNPWVTHFLAGPSSVEQIGWDLQPQLGNLMIANAFNPSEWVGKASSNAEYAAEAQNWTAAMESIAGWMNSDAGFPALQILGNAFNIHGTQTEGSKKKFNLGGTVGETVFGQGVDTGGLYQFHAGDRLMGPNQTAGQVGNDNSETHMLLRTVIKHLAKGNTISAQAPNQYGRQLNQNAGRRVRP